MQRTQIYLDDDILIKLKNIAKESKISVSEFIRKAIDMQLKNSNNLKSFLDRLEPLDSFKETDAKKYVDEIRSKSRIING